MKACVVVCLVLLCVCKTVYTADVSESRIPGRLSDVVFVTGEGDDDVDVIFLLTDEGEVYRSTDNGKSYQSQQSLLGNNFFEYVYQSPADPRYILFVSDDLYHFATSDAGVTYQQVTKEFVILAAEYHPVQQTWWIAIVPSDGCFLPVQDNCNLELWITQTNGASWGIINTYVSEATWGNAGLFPSISARTIYAIEAAVKEGQQPSPEFVFEYNLVESKDYFADTDLLVEYCSDIYYGEEFLFALTVNIDTKLPEAWVSARDEPFTLATLPISIKTNAELYVLDISESAIFIGYWDPSMSSTGLLLRSDSTGTVYELVLSDFTFEFSTVAGLQGTYVASRYSYGALKTYISFDRGITWQLLNAPASENPCSQCNLHLSNSIFDKLVYSSVGTVGTLVATGMVGESFSSKVPMRTFISKDGGRSWEVLLSQPKFAQFVYQGNVIQLLNITYDEDYVFSNNITNYEVLWTETSSPSENSWKSANISANFTAIVGTISVPDGHVQIVTLYSVNGTDITIISLLPYKDILRGSAVCGSGDVENYNVNCTLGRNVTYTRRKEGVSCLKFFNETTDVSVAVCDCIRDDYECDYGYQRDINRACVLSDPDDDPSKLCYPGSMYNHTQGYRRIIGDSCEGGLDLLPVTKKCADKKDDNDGDKTVLIAVIVGVFGGLILIAAIVFAAIFMKKKFWYSRFSESRIETL